MNEHTTNATPFFVPYFGCTVAVVYAASGSTFAPVVASLGATDGHGLAAFDQEPNQVEPPTP